MLKKLVKYGNSNALVLDKALLELLNIQEGSIVKIKTDGVSLIITPQETASQGVTPTVVPNETLKDAVQAHASGGTATGKAYMDELNAVCLKYGPATGKLNDPEVQKAIADLEQQFGGNRTDPEFKNAAKALHYKYVPELAELDKEIQAVNEKYPEESAKYCNANAQMSVGSAMVGFRAVFEKYGHIFAELFKLQSNPDFIHESVVLTEKYQATQNSPEYIQEYNDLVSKYIPVYAQLQAELKLVTESMK